MEEFHKAPIKFYPQLAARNRGKLLAYIGNGIRRFPAIILALLLLVTAVGAWNMAPALAASFITVPVLVPVFIYATRIVTLLVAALLFVGVLYLIGRPRKAREIENDLAAVFGVAKTQNSLFYRCPFLVSCQPVSKGTAAKEFVFWSRWQGLDRWNKPEIRQAVLWALNVHSEEDFTPGSKPYTVKIRAVSGALPEEREVQDPLF